jgi:hypothetical protein
MSRKVATKAPNKSAPNKPANKAANKALFGIDESLFVLPKDDEAAFQSVDVQSLLRSVDDIAAGDDDDVDENDPVLLKELEEVERGTDRHPFQDTSRADEIAALKKELESER